MKQLIEGIKDILEPYPLDYVDCFEHVIAVIFNWMRPRREQLFFVYRKLYQSFTFEEQDVEDVFRNYTDKLGIRCNKISIQENLIQEVKKIIDQGLPVAVPANLKMVYYADQYMDKDWPHLFLVKGYDDDKKLFYILDSTQQYNEDELPEFVDFVITYDQLETAFRGYKELREPIISYFELSEELTDSRTYVINGINALCEAFLNHQVMEQVLIEGMHEQVWDDEYTDFLLNYPKYRGIAMKSLIKCIEQFEVPCGELMELAEIIEERWKYHNLLFFRKIKKKGLENLKYDTSDEIKRDITMFVQELSKVKIQLSKAQSDIDQNTSMRCENNQDHIISVKDNKYIFNFNSGKVYNSWLSDNCPKIVLLDDESKLRSFCLKAFFEKRVDNQLEGHQEGIYIRTKNSLFTFGIDQKNIFHFDYVGKYTIEEFKLQQGECLYSLYVRRNDKMLSYGIMQDGQYIEYGKNEFTGMVKEIGVFCKTWAKCKELEVVYTKIELDTVE